MKHDYATTLLLLVAIATLIIKSRQWPTAVTMFFAAYWLAGGDFSTMPDDVGHVANALKTLFL